MERGGVVLDDAAVEDPLDGRDGVAGDLAAERGVVSGSAHNLQVTRVSQMFSLMNQDQRLTTG